jgi:SAM-dependent methyltransferase
VLSFDFEAEFFRSLLVEADSQPRRVLIVGCGPGEEVGHMADATGALVIGVDLDVQPLWNRPGAHVLRADARKLPFRDGAFDALYCYHVLEHVPEPERAISEARRVLEVRGIGFFGTPNKARVVGYVGGRASTWEKVAWNAADWWRRLRGRFENAHGAHAGFTDRELGELLERSFGRVESVSLPYYLGKYPRLGRLWKTSFKLGLGRFLIPSVYFRARNGNSPGVGKP